VLKQLTLILLIFLPLVLLSQSVKGVVYDSTSTVKGVKIFNKTQNSITVSDDSGEFMILAKIGDTLAFESLFHHPKVEVVKPYHFEGVAVIELKKVVNTLDEVEVLSNPKQPVFNEETFSLELKNLIEEDIKRNPELYTPQNNNQGVDFVYLFRKLYDLLKRKKINGDIPEPITYEQMDSIFSNSTLFNKRLLSENLGIPENRQKLFLEFCAAKQIKPELLRPEAKMALLEELVLNSQLFLILLEEYGQETFEKN